MPIDMSAAKAPPKRTGTRTARQPAEIVIPKTERERREEGLNGLGQLGQGALLMFKQYADAATVGMHWAPIARELAKAADGVEELAKPIDFLIQVGPWGVLLQAGLPFVMQLLANHKVVDASGLPGSGVVPPDVLEAQMKTQVMQMQLEAQRAQQEAQADYARMQGEMVKEFPVEDYTPAQT